MKDSSIVGSVRNANSSVPLRNEKFSELTVRGSKGSENVTVMVFASAVISSAPGLGSPATIRGNSVSTENRPSVT